MNNGFSRRRFLGGAATLAGLAAAAPVLAACSSGDGGASGLGIASQRLAFVPNSQFAGAYVADSKGYFIEEGFSGVELIPGGPTAPPIESDVLDRALIGVSQVALVGAAIDKGAPLKIIGALYPKNARCLLSMADNPIASVDDIYGKTIGVASSAQPIWENFIKSVGLDESRFRTIPVQGNPIGITAGEFDAYLGFLNNQVIDLQQKGFEVTTLTLTDAGYPQVGQTYITTTENIETNRDALVGFLRAEIRGWLDVLAEPQYATDLTVNQYGKDLGLDPAKEYAAAIVGNDLITDYGAHRQPISITEAQAEESARAVAKGGMNLSVEDLFDLSIIQQVHQDDPALTFTA